MPLPTEPLVTDRTESNVSEMNIKGFYNISDIQRIQAYIDYFAEQTGGGVQTHAWQFGERVDYYKWQYYILCAVDKLRKRYANLPKDTPATPTIVRWDYKKANDLEKILLAMKNATP